MTSKLEKSEAKTNLQADVSAKQRQLEESDLLLNLYRTVIESADLSSGFCSALELVCGFTGWIVGTAWLPSADETQLGLCSSWHRDDPKLAEFVALCKQQAFPRDVGLPGRVWHRKKQEWTRNLAAEPAELFPLAQAAANAGIKAAFAVPIIYNHHVDGVLMFPCAGSKGGGRPSHSSSFPHRNPAGIRAPPQAHRGSKTTTLRITPPVNDVPLNENKLRDQGDEKYARASAPAGSHSRSRPAGCRRRGSIGTHADGHRISGRNFGCRVLQSAGASARQ